MQAINAVSGSSWLRTANGQLVLTTPDGQEFYRGRPDPDAVLEALQDEDAQIQMEVLNWLRRSDVFGSGFIFKPINTRQLAPQAKRVGGMRL